MAVAFDSHFQKGAVSQSSPFSFVSNAGTVTGTVGGTNRVLIGLVGFSDTVAHMATVTMTWNSVSMTQITSVDLSSANGCIFLFGLINPATGNQTLSCSWTGGVSPSISLGATNFTSADQTTGWNNSGTDTGTGTSASSAITTTNGDMAVAGHVNNDSTSTVIGTGTSDWIDTAEFRNYGQARNPAVGASTTIAWTITSVAWANVKVNVMQPSSTMLTNWYKL